MTVKFENYRQLDPNCDDTTIECPVTLAIATSEVIDQGYFNKTIKEEEPIATEAYANASLEVTTRIERDINITADINTKEGCFISLHFLYFEQ